MSLGAFFVSPLDRSGLLGYRRICDTLAVA